jgi:thiol-disulfide isomerase/thioredoxin
MKKLFLLVLIPFLSSVGYSQMSSISGKADYLSKESKEITLFKIIEGAPVKIATTQFGDDGSFGFLFKVPSEAFYVIGIEKMYGFQRYIYLKPSDNANVVIEGNTKLRFTGENTPENKLIGEWYSLSDVCRNKSLFYENGSNFIDFNPEFDKLLTNIDPFLKNINTPNSVFNKRMAEWIKYDRDMFAIYIKVTPRSKHPQENEVHKFYQSLDRPSLRYPSDYIFDYMYGKQLVSLYVMTYNAQNGKANDLRTKVDEVATARQKGEVVIFEISNIKDLSLMEEIYGKYGKYFVNQSIQDRFDAKMRELFKPDSGKKALDFTYPDTNGNLTSLSDFKGKVVFVDVWATWCGPCKQQIPFMQEMEREFHGKDVVFISVSVDEENKKQDWLNMIKEKEMGGVQLFASGWSKICKDYNITGIPRFMLFDKNGNVVTINAPRPSDSKLKVLINNELAK